MEKLNIQELRKSVLKKETLLVILLCLVAFFVNKGALPTDIMEERNIITAREMVSDGTWLVPTMNGDYRLEKPPLPTWVGAAIEMVCPNSLSAQRTAAAVMGCLWAWFLYLTAKYIVRRREYALIAVMVFITCYNVIQMGRTATWDVYCHALMMGGIYCLLRGLYDDRSRSRTWQWFTGAGVLMGLSFMSKGPVSFYALLLPALLALPALGRPNIKGKALPLLTMIVLCVIIGGWWYAYIYGFHPDVVQAVIDKETTAWSNHNTRPWYYYWRFFGEMGVWGLLTVAALFVPYWKKFTGRGYLYAVAWMVLALVLLSLMPEKKMRYLLPMMVPCSLSVACLLFYMYDSKTVDVKARWLYRINGCLTGVIVIALPVVFYLVRDRMPDMGLTPTIVVDVLLVAIGVWLLLSVVRFKPLSFVHGIAMLFCVVEVFLLSHIGQAFGNPDRHSIELTQQVEALDGIPFYHPAGEALDIELVYEANRKIRPLDVQDSTTLKNALPCAIVSHQPIREVLPEDILSEIDATEVDVYDDNKLPKANKHYSDLHINHVTLLQPRQ